MRLATSLKDQYTDSIISLIPESNEMTNEVAKNHLKASILEIITAKGSLIEQQSLNRTEISAAERSKRGRSKRD